MVEFVSICKRYGALGVIAVWLFTTNKRVDTLETQLHDCNEDRIDIVKEYTKPLRSQTYVKKQMLIAVLPEKVKIKHNIYERSSRKRVD